MEIEKKNYWTAFSEETLADFAIEFNQGIDIKNVFDIIEQVLLMSEKYGICKVDIDGSYSEYLDYLKKEFDYTGFVYPYYLPGYKFYSNDFRKPFTELFLYKDEKVISVSVSELCNINYKFSAILLVKEYGRGRFVFDNYDPRYGELVAPISLSMGKVEKGQEKLTFWSISGSLKSDIWLEHVGSLKVFDKEGQGSQIEQSNNQELAYLNTPRLNSFLRGLKNLAKHYGGEWFLEFESNTKKQISNGLSSETDTLFFPLDGKIIYQEDIDEGRVEIPEF